MNTYPTAATVLSSLQHLSCDSLAAELLTLVRQLADHHAMQWRLEDECRCASTDQAVAAAKRAIDALNATRVDIIERIDDWESSCPRSADAAPHTETFGQLTDRLVIAWVRVQMLAAASIKPKLAAAETQLDELAIAYDQVLGDVTSSRRRFPAWRTLKQYGRTSKSTGR